jgi:hypothetical protein
MSTDECLQPPTTPANQNIRVVSNLITPRGQFTAIQQRSVDRAAVRQRVGQFADPVVALAREAKCPFRPLLAQLGLRRAERAPISRSGPVSSSSDEVVLIGETPSFRQWIRYFWKHILVEAEHASAD